MLPATRSVLLLALLSLLLGNLPVTHTFLPIGDEAGKPIVHSAGLSASGSFDEIRDVDIESLIEEYEQFHYAVHYPVVSIQSVDDVVRAAITERLDRYVSEATSVRDETGIQAPFSLNITFSMKYFADDFLSVVFRVTKYLGSEYSVEEVFAFNIDRRHGEILQLDDLFLPGTPYLERLTEFANTTLNDNGYSNDFPSAEGICADEKLQPEQVRHFALSENGLLLYFECQPELHETSLIIQVLVPYEHVADAVNISNLPASLGEHFRSFTDLNADRSADGMHVVPRSFGSTTPAMKPLPARMSGTSDKPTPQRRGTGPIDVEPIERVFPGTSDGSKHMDEPEPVNKFGEAKEGRVTKKESRVAKKKVALTFDDGPHKTVTPAILDELRERGVKATFFVLGQRVQFYPEIIRRIVEEGHEIGNHSWSHPHFTLLIPEEIQEEIERTQQVIVEAAGVEPLIVRPPYGAVNEDVLQAIEFPVVMWSVDTLDWRYREREHIVERALSDVFDGSVILFHDLYPSTAESVGEIIDHLQQEGYEFVTVSELFGFHDADAVAVGAGRIFRYYYDGVAASAK